MSNYEYDFFRSCGAKLAENGYTPIPIKPQTKTPGYYSSGSWQGLKGWGEYLNTPPSNSELAQWATWPCAGVGLLTGDIIAVDIDVLDRDLVSKILDYTDEILGETPLCRVGLEPKLLLVYRAAERIKKRHRGKVEILGEGQQFVAYGIHPSTKL